MTPLSAQQTFDRAQTALKSGAAAGLPELLELIETLSTDIYKVSLSELAVVIEKDATVLAKVITAANTLTHNPGIAPIATVQQAIHHVGFTRIRSLAVSLLLLEKNGRGRNHPEQREAAALALTSGLVAQGCAEQLGTIDPDVAFACATLRHFGELVLPIVSIEHTRAAHERLKTKPADIAWRGLFGLTPMELTRKLLVAAKLPEDVSRALRDCSPESFAGTATTYDTRLLCVTELGSRLARNALDTGMGCDAFAHRAREIAKTFDLILPGADAFVAPVMLKTGDRLQNFVSVSGLASLPTPGLRRIRVHAYHLNPNHAPVTEPPPAARPAGSAAVPETTAGETVAAAPAWPDDIAAAPAAAPELEPMLAEAPPTEPWDAALERAGAFAAQPTPPAANSLSTTLALARDSAQADTCWLIERLPGGASLTLTAGTGPEWKTLKGNAAVRSDERSVFGVCLTRQEVVVLHDTREPSIQPYLPAWWRSAAVTPRAVALVPLRLDAKTTAIALLGWGSPRRVNLAAPQLALVRQILAGVTTDTAAAA